MGWRWFMEPFGRIDLSGTDVLLVLGLIGRDLGRMDIALYPNDFLTRLHYFGLRYLIRLVASPCI